MDENLARDNRRVRDIYARTAPRYDRQMDVVDKILFAGARRWVCSQAHGDTLEIAVGTGRNLPYYPRSCRLIGIEYSPEMLEIARQRALEGGFEVDLRFGDAQALEFPDASFDAVVVTLALCTIPDDHAAVREVKRVLRPGGTLLLLEHVRSPVPVVRWGQRLLQPLVFRFEGDNLLREPLENLRSEGFEIQELHRSKAGIVEKVRALKPADRRVTE